MNEILCSGLLLFVVHVLELGDRRLMAGYIDQAARKVANSPLSDR